MMKQVLVTLDQVSKRFDAQSWFSRSRPVNAVKQVSLDIKVGEIFVLVGQSGAGKSTIAQLILGLEKANEGRIVFDGKDLGQLTEADWRATRQKMHLVFQDP